MIRLDYLIERDDSGKIVKFQPKDLPIEFECNVLYIKAPNATGKSTLLNLIALGLFGHKLNNDEIEPALKKRILELQQSSHQKVKFDLLIDNPEMGMTIHSTKKDLNIQDISVVKTCGKKSTYLSSDSFFREFRLIYDIPQKPLERLPQLISEVQTQQNDIGNRLGSLRESIRLLIEEIRNSKDPKILAQLGKKKENLLKDKESIESDLLINSDFYMRLKNYSLTKSFVDLFIKTKNMNERLEKVTELLAQSQREGQRITRIQTNISKQIADSIMACKNWFYGTKSILEKIIPQNERDRFNLWDQSLIENEVNYPETYNTLRHQTNHFIKLLRMDLDNEKRENSSEANKNEVFERLISILSDNRFSNITLPGSNQTVSDFLSLLSEEVKKFNESNKHIKDIKTCLDNLIKLEEEIEKCISLISEFRETEKQDENHEDENIQARLDEKVYLEQSLKKCEATKKIIREKLIENEIDPGNALELYQNLKKDKELLIYLNASDAQITNSLEGFKNSIISHQKKLKDLQNILTITQSSIDQMNNRETHKYYCYLEDLDVFYQYIQRLEQKFKNQFVLFAKHCVDISNGVLHNTNITELEKRYLESLEVYLASKIGHIRHIDEEYKVLKLDLLKQSFIVENINKGKSEIYFSDISTGQSQSMYLRSKLNINDNKKIIALFDEVASMDETSLEPIKSKLRELYFDKKLLLAIIVQKGEKVDITPLI